MPDKVRNTVFGTFLLPFIVAGPVGSASGGGEERELDDRPLGDDNAPFLFLHGFPQSASFDEILSPGVERRQFVILVLKPSGDEAEFHCMHNVRISLFLSTYNRSKGTRGDVVPGW